MSERRCSDGVECLTRLLRAAPDTLVTRKDGTIKRDAPQGVGDTGSDEKATRSATKRGSKCDPESDISSTSTGRGDKLIRFLRFKPCLTDAHDLGTWRLSSVGKAHRGRRDSALSLLRGAKGTRGLSPAACAAEDRTEG